VLPVEDHVGLFSYLIFEIKFEDAVLPAEDHVGLFSFLICEINFTDFMFDMDSNLDCGMILQEYIYEYILFRKVKIL